jgi:alpha-1,3-rhamnosyltransferase
MFRNETMKNELQEATAALPKVSVVIPSFNHSKYIEDAILSVMRQSFQEIELIVIDDGSTDGSVEKLRDMRKDYDFKLICQENRGVCKTLNRAICEASTGKYLALLASDDFWHKDKIRLQVEALSRSPESEFCFSQAREFVDAALPENGQIFPRRCREGYVLNSVFIRQHVPAGSMLFSRRLFDALGGFDEDLREEDWDFVIRSAAVTSFAAVNRPLLYYRAHDTNTMRTRSRLATFQQKAKILAKNMHLVSPWIWLVASALHFVHDIILQGLKMLTSFGAKQTSG